MVGCSSRKWWQGVGMLLPVSLLRLQQAPVEPSSVPSLMASAVSFHSRKGPRVEPLLEESCQNGGEGRGGQKWTSKKNKKACDACTKKRSRETCILVKFCELGGWGGEWRAIDGATCECVTHWREQIGETRRVRQMGETMGSGVRWGGGSVRPACHSTSRKNNGAG